MVTIVKSLPSGLDKVRILPIADWHMGDSLCNKELIEQQLAFIEKNKDVYVIFNGDLLNNATKTSVSDCYAEELSPMKQIEKVVSYLHPIKDRILGLTLGNHEKRSYNKEGVDLMEVISRELGLRDVYSQTGLLIFLGVGKDKQQGHNQYNYTIYANHGSGGGRKEGAKAIRLADMASIIDADIYIHSHTHLPMVMKQDFHRVDVQHKSVIQVTKTFVNTAATLNYGNYGEQYEFKPASTDTPILTLHGKKKKYVNVSFLGDNL